MNKTGASIFRLTYTMYYLLLIPLFFIVMIGYFRVADHYNIIDKPNQRSSHSELTIRGGGIIYLFAGMISLFLTSQHMMFFGGLFIIGVVSFIDDRITLSGKIRAFFQLISVLLMFYSLEMLELKWWIIVLSLILVIGIINAYNFMDGINGITGLYSVVILGSLQFVNYKILPFIDSDLIWLPIVASMTFLYYNFRKKAKCFAGDVGSVTVAFWIVFLIFKLILLSQNYIYILFLAVYGIDTILTIIHRIILRQNIFDAHRLHFYQILSNEMKVPQLIVSSLYACIQVMIISLILFSGIFYTGIIILTLLPLAFIYIYFKPKFMKKATLFSKPN